MTEVRGGLRVLDLARVVARHRCARRLAGLGVAGLQIDKSDSGDDIRRVAPSGGDPARGGCAIAVEIRQSEWPMLAQPLHVAR